MAPMTTTKIMTTHTWAVSEKSPIISEEQYAIICYVGFVFMSLVTCSFGIGANVINIIVFLKQGFKSSVNITLFGMSISDVGSCIILLWVCVCMIPSFRTPDSSFPGTEMTYLTGGLPSSFFGRVTNWFIAFATIERCLSVLVPLKVKQIITPRRTIIFLVLNFVINFLCFTPEYFVGYLDWKFDEKRNKTMIAMVYDKDTTMGRLVYILVMFFAVFSIGAVMVFTAILVTQLRQKAKWRQTVTRDKNQTGTLSQKDKNTIKLVLVLSSMLIACNIPTMLLTLTTVFEKDFGVDGAYERLWLCVWGFAFFFQGVNASINIFFYYHMSTHYRQCLDQLFPCMKRHRP